MTARSSMPSKPPSDLTDYPSLTNGHSEASCTDISIVGLHVQVYGLKEIQGSSLPIAAVVRFTVPPPMLYYARR